MTFLSRFLRGLRRIALATFVVVSVIFSANSAWADNECNPMESVSLHINVNMDSVRAFLAANDGVISGLEGTHYDYTLSQCLLEPSSYDFTNTYSGLKCYIAIPNAADAYCDDTGDSNMCGEDGTIYSPEQYTYAFFMGNVDSDGDGEPDEKIVLDAAGNMVNTVNEALDAYFNTYQNDFATWLFNSDYNSFYNNSCGQRVSTINLFCFESTYLTHAPLVDHDQNTQVLPIDTSGGPLFSNVYYPNMDGYAVAYQTYYGELTPPVVFYDFRRDTGTNYGYPSYLNLTNTTNYQYNGETGYNVGPYDSNSGRSAYDIYADITTPYGGNMADFISELENNGNPYSNYSYSLDLTNTDYTDALNITLSDVGSPYYSNGDYNTPQENIQLLNYYDGYFDNPYAVQSPTDLQYGSNTEECIGDDEGFGIVPSDQGGGGGEPSNPDPTPSCSTGYHYDSNLSSCVANTYVVNLGTNGGNGNSQGVIATYGQAMPTTCHYNCANNETALTIPTRTGYTFGGWYDTSAATGGTQYYTANGTSAHTWDIADNTTLYARWTPNTYNITYNVMGGKTIPSDYTPVEYIEAVNGDKRVQTGHAAYYNSYNVLLRTKWMATGRPGMIHGGNPIAVSSTNGRNSYKLTLSDTNTYDRYAVYADSTTPIIVENLAGNTPHEITITSGRAIVDGTTYTAPVGTSTKMNSGEPMAVLSWVRGRSYGAYSHYTNNYGIMSIFDLVPVRRNSDNMCGMINAESPNNGFVTMYDNNSKTVSEYFTCPSVSSKPDTYTAGFGANIVWEPTRLHSKFAGWCTDSALTDCTMHPEILPSDSGNKTYYAKYTCDEGYTQNAANTSCNRNAVIIDWDENGGSAIANTNCNYDANVTMPTTLPTKAGYTLIGWQTADGEILKPYGTMYGLCVKTHTGVTSGTSTAIKAVWGETNIEYVLNGGTNNQANLTYYEPGVGKTLQVPTKAGYYFVGWCDDANLQTNCARSKTIPADATGTQTVYAKWAKFAVSATVSANNTLAFQISAKGTFTVDWGDGTVDTIDRSALAASELTSQTVSHQYTNAGTYIIGFDGVATEYSALRVNTANNDWRNDPIGQYTNNQWSIPTTTFRFTTNSTKITAIYGYLGHLFPTLNSGAVSDKYQPKFLQTFQDTNISSIPAELFHGSNGTTNGVKGGGKFMFAFMFYNVKPIQSIPSTLFAGITTAGDGMFTGTFEAVTELRSIPYNLFSTITGNVAPGLFKRTFSHCGWVQSIDERLFSSMSGDLTKTAAFNHTFSFTGITSIPENLFASFSGGVGHMVFYATFYGTKITSIPAGLFRTLNGTGSMNYTFWGTFANTKIKSVPIGLFNNFSQSTISSYANTFQNCTDLESIPYNLFANITYVNANHDSQFANTFNGCSKLNTVVHVGPNDTTYTTSFVPTTFFKKANLNTVTNKAGNMFAGTGLAATCPSGTTSKKTVGTKQLCEYNINYENASGADGLTPATYIDNTTDITLPTPTKINYTFENWYDNSSFTGDPVTTIPAYSHAEQTLYAKWVANNIFYDIDGGTNNANNPENYTEGEGATIDYPATKTNYIFAGWCTDAQKTNCAMTQTIATTATGTQTVYAKWAKFSLTTTSTNTFSFKISASGSFYADCGNGGTLTGTGVGADGKTITRTDTTEATYTCTWGSSAVQTIILDGLADLYNNSSTATAAISFYTSAANTVKIKSISGSLGSIFPTLNNGATESDQPKFIETFRGATSLTSIPGILFYNPTDPSNGVSGSVNAISMFENTFYGCTYLTALPGNLFSNITTGASRMFYKTFADCDRIGQLPHGLFGTVSAGAPFLFYGTFSDISNVYHVYSDLFSSNFTSVGESMFELTFGNSALQGLPEGVFSGVKAYAKNMFKETFTHCGYMTSYPNNLFTADDSCKEGLFQHTFYSNGYINQWPSDLFAHVTGCAKNCFRSTFSYSKMDTIPDNFFPNITCVSEGMFAGTFNSGNYTSIPDDLFANITNGSAGVEAFSGTFMNRKFTSVPAGLFSKITSVGARGFQGTFKGCTKLTTLPDDLFYSVKSAGSQAFYETFSGDTALKQLPNHLFGITSFGGDRVFDSTFYNTGLTSLPDDLFQSITTQTQQWGVFQSTFRKSKLTSIPSNLFDKVTDYSFSIFNYTFAECPDLEEIPSGLFKMTKPIDGMFSNTFYSCKKLKYIPYDLFASFTSGPRRVMFNNTFTDCTALDSVVHTGQNGTTYTTPFLTRKFFGNLSISYADGFDNPFKNTGLVTTCPDYAVQQVATSAYAAANMNNKVFCQFKINYENVTDASELTPKSYIDNTSAITLANPTKTGYDFGGWYTDSGFTTGNEATNIPAYSYGAKTYYAKWTAHQYMCPAGQYLPAGNDWETNNYNGCTICPADNYCPGDTYSYNETTTQGAQSCPQNTHPYAPRGMWMESQCGRILHLGDEMLYLHQQPAYPSLHQLKVLYSLNNTEYSANAVLRDTNSNDFPKMSDGMTKGLHVMIHDTINGVEGDYEYLICDDSVEACRGGAVGGTSQTQQAQ